MIQISNLREGKTLFKALGSDIRISILELLLERENMNLNDLASALGLTNGALTTHIRLLESAGMIAVNKEASVGNEKRYHVISERILIQVRKEAVAVNAYETDLGVGLYSSYEVTPSCGLSTPEHYVGQLDDPRYFAHPDRCRSDILWFTQGYVEYMIPNFLPPNQKADQISITAELCSEAPGSNDLWPSDIHFYLNDVLLGYWTSPGDLFGTMYYDGRYKLVNYHGKEFGELYDHEKDPDEFENLWDVPEYAGLKAELIKKNFDSAIMKNMDYSMNRINEY